MNLRDDIAQAIFKRKRDEAVKDGLGYLSTIPREFCEYADDALAVLASAALDPVRLRAILELIGLEVREGWEVDVSLGYTHCVTFNDLTPGSKPVLVCRVRPQGEETNA